MEIPCFVLDDGRRVISGRGMTTAIGMKGRGQGIARISGHRMLVALENNQLAVAIASPVLSAAIRLASWLVSRGLLGLAILLW